MKTKKCSRCLAYKYFEEFHRASKEKTGRRPECKKCTAKRKKELRDAWTPERREKEALKDKDRRSTGEYKKHRIQWARDENGEHTEAYKRYKEKSKGKDSCWSKFKRAKKAGKIVAEGCRVCGTTENIDGHHEDYSKPLDVLWLCRKHHRLLHSGQLSLAIHDVLVGKG